MVSTFKGFCGKVVLRGDESYEESVYQYAWSSHSDEGIIEPDAILYAQNDADVIRAINYAKTHNIAIAVRTGGHQYSGASSTNGRNIQLDLSLTYTGFLWENTDLSQVTLGISINLDKFQKKLEEQGRFVPMGVCSQVHLGGHIQTGGYGQLTRSFGLLADYVQKVRVITADGQVRWVERGIAKDKDLLYAILGGSPGNFGVITDVTLNVLKDEDHPESRGFRAVFPYSEATLKRLLDVMIDQDDMPDTPGDYDYCVSMMSARPTEGRPAVIVAFAHWANLEGHKQPYRPEFFEKIMRAGGADKMMPYFGVFLDGKAHTPMSVLCSHWLLPVARVFPLPYYKHTNLSNSNCETLKANNWSQWVSGRIQELEADPSNGCFVGLSFSTVEVSTHDSSATPRTKSRLLAGEIHPFCPHWLFLTITLSLKTPRRRPKRGCIKTIVKVLAILGLHFLFKIVARCGAPMIWTCRRHASTILTRNPKSMTD